MTPAHRDRLLDAVTQETALRGYENVTLAQITARARVSLSTFYEHFTDKRDAVLAAFTGRLPDQKLPFGVTPTSQGARGSDVIIEGITSGLTITLNGFNRA